MKLEYMYSDNNKDNEKIYESKKRNEILKISFVPTFLLNEKKTLLEKKRVVKKNIVRYKYILIKTYIIVKNKDYY